MTRFINEKQRTTNKLFLRKRHTAKISFKYISSPASSSLLKEKFHFNKQVIHVFLGVKFFHVREAKKKKNLYAKMSEKIFLGIFFFSAARPNEKKI